MDQGNKDRQIRPKTEPRFQLEGRRPVRPFGVTILAVINAFQGTFTLLLVLAPIIILAVLRGSSVTGLGNGLIILGVLSLLAFWVAANYLVAFGFWRMERYSYKLAIAVYIILLVSSLALNLLHLIQPTLSGVIWNIIDVASLAYLLMPTTRQLFN